MPEAVSRHCMAEAHPAGVWYCTSKHNDHAQELCELYGPSTGADQIMQRSACRVPAQARRLGFTSNKVIKALQATSFHL